MRSELEFKTYLMELKEKEWNVPEGTDCFALAEELIGYLGALDAELRDLLVYELLYVLITEEFLTDEQRKALGARLLSEECLFYKIGSTGDDSVLKRAFSILEVQGLLYRHNEQGLYTQEELIDVVESVLRYSNEEKDVRGHLGEKGWAHTAAHTSDALAEAARCEGLDKHTLERILTAVKDKLCVGHYAYVNLEDERNVTAVLRIVERGVDISEWIRSIPTTGTAGDYVQGQTLAMNRRNLLSALYFRLKRRNGYEDLLPVIEEAVKNSVSTHFH